jgi:TPR repeat protein
MESKLVAANLKTLTERHIVETITTKNRNNLYRISERFFNMWLIVTQGNPDHKRKARWMSEFLESWYDKPELQAIALEHLEKLKTSKISGREGFMLSKGLSQSKYIDASLRDEIITYTKAELKDSIKNFPLQLPETTNEIIEKVNVFIEQGNYQKAFESLKSIENKEDSMMFLILGFLYENLEKYELAEKYYLQAIEKGHVEAMFNLGNLYKDQGKFDLAEKYWFQAIEKGDVKAMFNLGNLYKDQEKYELAEKYWFQAIEKGDVKAMFNLGLLYDDQGKFDLAEKYWLQAIGKGDVKAMFNIGSLYFIQEKDDLAEKYWLQAIEKGHVKAMFNLSLSYYYKNINKEQVKNWINQYGGIETGKIIIEIWVEEFNNIEERAINECSNERENAFFFESLLIHHQKSLVDKLFHHAEFGLRLQAQYMALYYVSQILNGKEDDNNLKLRIPPELQTTVDDVLQRVKKEQIRYAISE